MGVGTVNVTVSTYDNRRRVIYRLRTTTTTTTKRFVLVLFSKPVSRYRPFHPNVPQPHSAILRGHDHGRGRLSVNIDVILLLPTAPLARGASQPITIALLKRIRVMS